MPNYSHTNPQYYDFRLNSAELVAKLQQFLRDQHQADVWQLCWLNNAGRPVIGILPKVSWTVLSFGNQSCDKDIASRTSSLNINQQQRKVDISNNIVFECETQQYNHIDWVETLVQYTQNFEQNDVNENKTSSKPLTKQKRTFAGGLMGFIGYDLSAKTLSPSSVIPTANQPLAFLGHYDIWLEQNTCDLEPEEMSLTTWTLYASSDTDDVVLMSVKSALEKFAAALESQNSDSIDIQQALSSQPRQFQPTWTYDDYVLGFETVQSHLYAGDSYQINLTQPWQSDMPKTQSLVNYLPALHGKTQAPFAGFVTVDGFELLSCSPELFLTFEQSDDGIKLITKPIKGTRPRGQTTAEDDALKAELIQSEKDQAENVMIVDLLRNDLGRYAKTGSVTVPKLFAIESFSNVHHMVSTVTATLAEGVHPLTALFASLPAGSITGAPKKRSVELIGEIECEPRGAYCGTMGYLNIGGTSHGTGQWNVLIRTIQKQADGKVSVWAGGGITVGSVCEAEYQECLDKVGNLLGVLQSK